MIDINKPIFTGTPASGDAVRFDTKTLNWDAVPKGTYNATVVAIYPFKDFKKDAYVNVLGDDGKPIWHDDGSGTIKEMVKDLEWSMADVVYRIDDGEYAGHGVKGSLSTHPDFVGRTKQFVYNTGLFDTPLNELYKHAGDIKMSITTYTRTNKYKDKDTGMDVVNEESMVSYTSKLEDTSDDSTITGL